jgi:hypothetical protein
MELLMEIDLGAAASIESADMMGAATRRWLLFPAGLTRVDAVK